VTTASKGPLVKGKDKVHYRTGNEGPVGSTGITVLFL